MYFRLLPGIGPERSACLRNVPAWDTRYCGSAGIGGAEAVGPEAGLGFRREKSARPFGMRLFSARCVPSPAAAADVGAAFCPAGPAALRVCFPVSGAAGGTYRGTARTGCAFRQMQALRSDRMRLFFRMFSPVSMFCPIACCGFIYRFGLFLFEFYKQKESIRGRNHGKRRKKRGLYIVFPKKCVSLQAILDNGNRFFNH